MSNRLIKPPFQTPKTVCVSVIYRLILCTVLLLGSGLRPSTIDGQETPAESDTLGPLLVKALRTDTLTRLARRYLNDVSKAWIIAEYNDVETISGGETILIPRVPFRPGGLTPDGFQTVPVLAYSSFGPERNDAPEQKSRVSWSAFNDQMRWLKTQGFTAISPAELVDFMDFSGQLPKRAILISADTQSRAFFERGVPILKANGFRATLFAATDEVGREGAMTWEQIEQLHQDGFTIACRGQSGRSLTRQAKGVPFEAYFKAVESELRLAQKAIETHLDAPCRFLAYPQGSTNSLVSAMAAKLGFFAAFTLSPGSNPFFADRFRIHRIAMDGSVNPEQFTNVLTTMITADLN